MFLLDNDDTRFPDPVLADPDSGLLAVGGDLAPARLLSAYSNGIFPWYDQGDPILWWSPDPRLVLFPEKFHLSGSLGRTIRRGIYQVTFDRDFAKVIKNCAEVRITSGKGTWITADMIAAYCRLHKLGHAHSVECRRNGDLVGGLYGVALGGVFFGESMFSLATDSSKVALAALVERLKEWRFDLIDCQVASAHLKSLGAGEISGAEFRRILARSLKRTGRPGPWTRQDG